MKKILIISSSPRKNGNSEALSAEFARGAADGGNQVEKINLREKKIGYCINCDACRRNQGDCVFKDDAQEIVQKALDCDVLVLSTPVYFYNVSAQLKTLIDRFYAREHEFWNIPEKKVYYIITNAAGAKEYQESTVAVLDGFIKCLRTVKPAGIIRGIGTMAAGDVKEKPAMAEAYNAGKNL